MTPKEAEILERYRMRAIAAWNCFDELFDAGKDASQAEAEAIRLQQAYFMQYYLTDDCTCKPDSAIACDVCAAQIKSKSREREEI